jgi:hypothetical protein
MAIEKVGAIKYAPCRISRQIYFTYDYAGIPAWADDRRLRLFFPDMIGTAEARTIHHDGESLVRGGDEWSVAERIYGPYFIPCSRSNERSFKTD